MTAQAWLMLVVTWAIIIFFTVRFFLKVLMTPPSPEHEAQARDGILEKDA
jgi:hypothetical protein